MNKLLYELRLFFWRQRTLLKNKWNSFKHYEHVRRDRGGPQARQAERVRRQNAMYSAQSTIFLPPDEKSPVEIPLVKRKGFRGGFGSINRFFAHIRVPVKKAGKKESFKDYWKKNSEFFGSMHPTILKFYKKWDKLVKKHNKNEPL